jgi:adenosine kinase
LAQFGERPRLFATAGEDYAEHRKFLEGNGVNTSGIRLMKGEYTASFFSNTDLANSQIASFYPGAMAYDEELSLSDLGGERPELVLISPTIPQAMVRFVNQCKQFGIPYIYDPSQQIPRLKDEDLIESVEGSLALFVNQYEFGMIQKRTGFSSQEIQEKTQFLVVTQGEEGSLINWGEDEVKIPIVVPEQITNPTGAGDSFRGGFLAGYANGWDLETCAQMGAVTAAFCLECDGPQGHTFSMSKFVDRFRENFDDHGKLDALLE